MTNLTQFLTAQRREINAALGDVALARHKLSLIYIKTTRLSEAKHAIDLAEVRLLNALDVQDAAIELELRNAAALAVEGGEGK